MLTDNQKKNIYNLDFDTSIEILQIIAERWGIVSPKEYSLINDMPIRTVYAKIDSKKIKTIDISSNTFAIINN